MRSSRAEEIFSRSSDRYCRFKNPPFKTSFATKLPALHHGVALVFTLFWCPRRDSNPQIELRRLAFYPLDYGGNLRGKKPGRDTCPVVKLRLITIAGGFRNFYYRGPLYHEGACVFIVNKFLNFRKKIRPAIAERIRKNAQFENRDTCPEVQLKI